MPLISQLRNARDSSVFEFSRARLCPSAELRGKSFAPNGRTIVLIGCDEEDVFNLLDAARRLYPDAVPAIAAGIDLKSTAKHGQLVNRRQ